MTSEEKKLVGSYTYSDVSNGYWTYNSYNTDRFTGSSMFAETFSFKSDGTYEKLQLAVGSIHPSGGVFFKVTGNWHISVKGTVCLSNSIGNAIYTDGTQDLNYKKSDESYKYTFSKKDGKNGIYGFSISSWFYKKD